jgi:hypothetical protein
MLQRLIPLKVGPVLATFAIATLGSVGLIANAGCLPDAKAEVRVDQRDENERMTVRVSGLPGNTEFDLFIIQLPDAPFGVAWYQSDLDTNHRGDGRVTVQGRFNHETFSLSQGGPDNGSDPLQNLTGPAVKDTNVKFRPTSQFHVGLWFNSAEDAAAAGCAGTVTPFNGEQHAGVQVLSTRNFPADHGPLEAIG